MKFLSYSLASRSVGIEAKHTGKLPMDGGTGLVVTRVLRGGKLLRLWDGEHYDVSGDPAEIPADRFGNPKGLYAVTLGNDGRVAGIYKLESKRK